MFRSLCCYVIATIQHFLTLSTHPLSLTLLPTSLILHIGTHPVGDAGSEITLSLRQYLRIVYRPFHTISFRSLSLLPICRIHHVNGLPTCRDCHYTSLGVCGRCEARTRKYRRTGSSVASPFQHQPSLLSCLALFRKVFFRLLRRYGIATIALHRRSSISPDAKSL